MRLGAGPRSLAPRIGMASLLLSPFAFGAVPSTVWAPLAWLWIALGAWTTFQLRADREPAKGVNPLADVVPVFAVIHVILALQLLPLPPEILRTVSPGSYAAHWVPPSSAQGWAPLTTSPSGTLQTWLFLAGLHGLVYALFRRPYAAPPAGTLLAGMTLVGAVLALVGLMQAASPNPYFLYGVFQVPGAGPHEAGIFGPYYNRDHFSNLLALASSIAAGLLSSRLMKVSRMRLAAWPNSLHFPAIVWLSAACVIMLVASAASGSRGGLAAIVTGVLVGLGPTFLARPRMALASLAVLLLVLFGTGVPSAIERLGDVDFEASRLMVWRDSLRLTNFFPLLGCGLGAFGACYWPYQRVVRFEYWPHAHNEFLQWVIEAGVVGVLVALYVARRLWVRTPGIVRSHLRRPALAAIAAAAVHATVDCGLRIPANGAWTAVLFVYLFVEDSGDRLGRSADG